MQIYPHKCEHIHRPFTSIIRQVRNRQSCKQRFYRREYYVIDHDKAIHFINTDAQTSTNGNQVQKYISLPNKHAKGRLFFLMDDYYPGVLHMPSIAALGRQTQVNILPTNHKGYYHYY